MTPSVAFPGGPSQSLLEEKPSYNWKRKESVFQEIHTDLRHSSLAQGDTVVGSEQPEARGHRNLVRSQRWGWQVLQVGPEAGKPEGK